MVKKITLIILSLLMVAIAATAVTLGLVFRNDTADSSQGTEQGGDSSSTGDTLGDGSNGGNTNGDGSNGGGNSGNGGSNSGGNSGGNGSGGNGGGTQPPQTHVCSFKLKTTVPAGCLNGGYSLYSCSCGKEEQRDKTKALGHDYKQTIHMATCQTDWSMTEECTRCNDAKTQTVEDSKVPCEYDWTDTLVATCTTDGSQSGTCKWCGGNQTRKVNALGHDHGAFVSNNDATCAKDGTETATCSRCPDTVTQDVEGSKLPHTFGLYIPNNDAACDHDETKTATCAKCGAKDSQDIPNTKLPHTWGDYYSDLNADCKNHGTMTANCENCSATNTLPDPNGQLGEHNYSWTVKTAATCMQLGEKEGKCKVCGDVTVKYDYANHSTDKVGAICSVCKLPVSYMTSFPIKNFSTFDYESNYGEIMVGFIVKQLNGKNKPLVCDIYIAQYDKNAMANGVFTLVAPYVTLSDVQVTNAWADPGTVVNGSLSASFNVRLKNVLTNNTDSYKFIIESLTFDESEPSFRGVCVFAQTAGGQDVEIFNANFDSRKGLVSGELTMRDWWLTDVLQVSQITGTAGLEYHYYSNGDYYEVIGYGTASGDIVVPAAHNGSPVKLINILDHNNGITSLVIPDSVTDMGIDAFFGCENLTSISIGSGMTRIRDKSFGSCTKLTSVSFGSNVTEIQQMAFLGCSALKRINFDGTKAQWNTIKKGTNWDKGTGNYLVVCTDGVLPDTDATGLIYQDNLSTGDSYIVNIGTAKGDVVIPSTHNGYPVTSVQWAFNGNLDLTSIVIPDSVTDVPADAFFGCSNLKSVTIGKGISCLTYHSFGDCGSLASVTISNSVTYIEERAFANAIALKEIKFGGTKAQWNAITKESDWDTNTGNYTVKCSDGTISK